MIFTIFKIFQNVFDYFFKVVRSILGNFEDRGDYEVVVIVLKDDVVILEKFIKLNDGNV